MERAGRLQEQKRKEVDETSGSEPVKVAFNLGPKSRPRQQEPPKEQPPGAAVEISTFSSADVRVEPTTSNNVGEGAEEEEEEEAVDEKSTASMLEKKAQAPKMSLSFSSKPKRVNPLMKKNPLLKKKAEPAPEPEKKMSNAERIMREEMERKRKADERIEARKKQRL